MGKIQRRNEELRRSSRPDGQKVKIWLAEFTGEASQWQIAEPSASDWLAEFRSESELDDAGVRRPGPRRLLPTDWPPPPFEPETPAPSAPVVAARPVAMPRRPVRTSRRGAALAVGAAAVLAVAAIAVSPLGDSPGATDTIAASAVALLPSDPPAAAAIPVARPKATKTAPAPSRAPAKSPPPPTARNAKPDAPGPAKAGAGATPTSRSDDRPPNPSLVPVPASTPAAPLAPPSAAVVPTAPPRAEPTPTPAVRAEPPPAPAPTPVAPPATAPPPSRPPDSIAVQSVLGRYRDAFGALNAEAVAAFWPTVNTRQLRKAFDQLDVQQFDLGACRVDITGAKAVASCNGKARYVQKVGSRSTRVDARRWTFNLKKVNETWLIESVSSR